MPAYMEVLLVETCRAVSNVLGGYAKESSRALGETAPSRNWFLDH